YAEAERLLRRALEIARVNLELAAVGQSERQQLAMAQEFIGYLGDYLSLAPAAQITPEAMYRHVLAAKGTVFDRQRRLRHLRRRLQTDPGSDLAPRLVEYQQTVTRLATLALATPNPAQAPAWRKDIDELSRRRERLESEMSGLDAGFRDDRDEAARTPERLAA